MKRALVVAFGLTLVALPASAQNKAECVAAAQDAQDLREKNELQAAREKLLICAREACPKIVRVDCAKWLDEVQTSMPSIVVRAKAVAAGEPHSHDDQGEPRQDARHDTGGKKRRHCRLRHQQAPRAEAEHARGVHRRSQGGLGNRPA